MTYPICLKGRKAACVSVKIIRILADNLLRRREGWRFVIRRRLHGLKCELRCHQIRKVPTPTAKPRINSVTPDVCSGLNGVDLRQSFGHCRAPRHVRILSPEVWVIVGL